MEQQIFTITVHRPMTRMERLRMRRRRNWEIAKTVLWVLTVAAMAAIVLASAGKKPEADTAGAAESGKDEQQEEPAQDHGQGDGADGL